MKSRYIRKFKLSNVKTFEHEAEIDFCLPSGKVARWTVILGENGLGKTTLLQYIAGCMPILEAPEAAAVVDDKGVKKKLPSTRPLIAGQDWFGWHQRNIRNKKTPARVESGIVFSDAVESLSQERPDPKFKDWTTFHISFDKNKNGGQTIETSYLISEKEDFHNEIKIFAYGAGRHVASNASPYLASDSFSRNKASSPVQTLFHDDIPLISPEQWLLSLHHTSNEGGAVGTLFKKKLKLAQECLARALPDIKRIRVGAHGNTNAEMAMSVLFETPFATVPFSSLSLGYRSMAAWLTDFLKRMLGAYPNLAEPENGAAIVLVDEFDLHMHPAWQRNVMTALSAQFPNVQFIVTAHSPLIVQHCSDETKIAVLRKIEKNGSFSVTIDSDPKFAAGWRVDQILQSDLYSVQPRAENYNKLMERRLTLRRKDILTKAEGLELAEIEAQLDAEAPPGVQGSQVDFMNEFKKILSKS
jgi:energy-coupling factor transporter ATP-binding protein EcfA2